MKLSLSVSSLMKYFNVGSDSAEGIDSLTKATNGAYARSPASPNRE